jgi:hypothetical protein
MEAAATAAFAQMRGEMQQMQNEMTAMRADRTAADAATATQGALVVTLGNLATTLDKPPQKQLIDQRGLGRPQTFQSNEDKFQGWAQKTEAFFAGVFPQIEDVLEWACQQIDVITHAEI